jgi:hypothetical protein
MGAIQINVTNVFDEFAHLQTLKLKVHISMTLIGTPNFKILTMCREGNHRNLEGSERRTGIRNRQFLNASQER